MIVAIMTTALSGTVWAETSTLTFTAKCNGSGTANDGASWTVTSDASESNFDNERGIHYGTNSAQVQYITLTTNEISGTITKIIVNASGNNNPTLSVTVGGNAFGTSATVTTSNTAYTFTGSASGAIVVDLRKGTKANKALYVKSIEVTYTPAGSSAVATTTTINASGITNTDVYTSTEAGSLSATVKDNNNAKDVATIDEDGVVTLVAAGTTIITASYAGVANQYQSSSAPYELTVTDSTPFSGSIFIFNTDAGLTELGITKPGASGGTDLDATEDYTIGIVTMNITHGGTNTRVWNGGSATDLRVYNGGSLTFAVPAGYAITKVTFAGSSTTGISGLTNNVWTASGDPVNTVTFSCTATSKINTITVEYEANNTPIISAEDVNLGYNETTGTISYSVTNPVTGGVVTAASSEAWLTVGTPSDGTIALSCAANTEAARTAIVTLTYTYNTNKTVTHPVTVTQAAAPVTYTTIPDLFAAATSTETNVNVTFGNWVVSGVHNNNVFLTDNQGNGLIIYTSNHGFAVNDKLSGTVSETPLKLYNGFAEFTNLTASTTGLTVTKDGEITVITNKTIAELGGVNTGAVITLSNLTYDGTNLSDGTNTIKPYNSLYNEMSLTSDKTYNITGVYQQYSGTKEILPRSAADIVEVQAQHSEYTLTVSTLTNVEMFVFDAANQSSALIDGEGSAQVYDGTQVLISVSAEAGYELESLIVDGNDVTSEIVSDAYTFTMPTHAVTVTATAVAVIPPTSASGKYVKVTSTADITDGGQYLIVCEDANVALNGDLETLDAISNTIGVTISGNEIVATSATVAAEFTIAVIDGGYSVCSAKGEYIYHTGSKNTLNTSDEAHANSISFDEGNVLITVGSYNLKYNATSGQTRFRYFTTDQTAIQLYKKVESVTVTSAGYATYCSEKALDFTDTDIKAYVGTKNGDKLTFTSIDQVPAGTGLLLVYEGGKTENVPVIASATAVEGNCLVGVNAETTINSTDYILNKVNDGVGFYKAGSYTTLGAHKAYIPAAVGGNVKGFTIDFDDDATGISLMEDGRSQMEDGVIYNVAGQRISKMQKGINIVNGKKILK